jgi:hypothetical protein
LQSISLLKGQLLTQQSPRLSQPVASRKNLFEMVIVASLKIYPKEIAQVVVKSTN